jgi:hypothetical protein
VLYRNKLRLALPQVAKIDACEYLLFLFLLPKDVLLTITATAYVKVN